MAAKSLPVRVILKVWTLAALLLVLFTVYISFGRVVLPRISNYQPEIQQYLSDTLKAQVSFDRLTGAWQGFQPSISLHGLTVLYEDKSGPGISVERAEFRLDVYSSLLARLPVFSSFLVEGVALELHQTVDGKWAVKGRQTEQAPTTLNMQLVAGLLLAQKNITAKNVTIKLQGNNPDNSSTAKRVEVEALTLRCHAGTCSSKGNMALVDGDYRSAVKLALNAENATTFQNINLDAYIDYEPVKLENWYRLSGLHIPVLDRIGKAHWGGRFWINARQGKLDRVQGNIRVPEFEVVSGNGAVGIDNLKTSFVWQNNQPSQGQFADGSLKGINEWSLNILDLSFNRNRENILLNSLQVSLIRDQGQPAVNVAASQIDVGVVNDTMLAIDLLPEKLAEVFATLAPRGMVTNVHASFNPGGSSGGAGVPGFNIEANLDSVEVSPWGGVPGATGISGYLYATPNNGRVELKANRFSIFFPKYYSKPFGFDQAQGIIHWKNRGKEFWLDSDALTLRDKSDILNGQFSLAQPKDGTEPWFDLLIGLKQSKARPMLKYVPDQLLSTNLVDWLDQSIIGGDVHNARFMYSGPAVKGASKDDISIRLELSTSAAELAYLPGWPHLANIDAQVNLADNTTRVTARAANMMNLDLKDIEVDLKPYQDGNLLTVSSAISGPTSDGLSILQDTPLRDTMFDLIDDFKASGELTATLGLRIHLLQEAQNAIDLDISTENSGLTIPSLDIAFDQIKGNFNYSSATGLSAKSVQATLFDEPVVINIQSTRVAVEGDKKENQDKQQVMIDMAGKLGMDKLRQWKPIPLFTKFKGKSDYRASLSLGGGLENRLTVATDLIGVQADLPKPFKKLADVTRPLYFSMVLDDEQQHFIRYGKELDIALAFNGKEYTEGEVVLGGSSARLTRGKGINLAGSLSVLDTGEWVEFFGSFDDAVKTEAKPGKSNQVKSVADNDDNGLSRLTGGKVNISAMDFYGLGLEDVAIEANQLDGDWSVEIDSALVDGRVYQFRDKSKPISVALEYLRLPAGEKSPENKDALINVVPQDLPALNFSTREFSVGGENYGAWSFNLRPNNEGANIEQLSLDSRGLIVSGNMAWQLKNGLHSTGFQGNATTSDIANVLNSWGFSPSVEGKKGLLEGNLSWPGSPAGFSVPLFSGEVLIKAKDGRFKEMEAASNALKIFGVLNFNSIARRLRLDFSDLTKKGYSYDTVKGILQFNAGEIIMKDSLVIDGPSAKFKIDGRTDLVNKQYYQDMIVVLPVTGNLPIAAAIVGAPMVGVPLYLINKIFSQQFERFTSAYYKITGPWDNPKVELVSVFTKKSEADGSPAPEVTEDVFK